MTETAAPLAKSWVKPDQFNIGGIIATLKKQEGQTDNKKFEVIVSDYSPFANTPENASN